MKKLVMSAAFLAALAAPAFAHSYHARVQTAPAEQARAQAYASRDFAYGSDESFAYGSDREQRSTLSPGSTSYAPDTNR